MKIPSQGNFDRKISTTPSQSRQPLPDQRIGDARIRSVRYQANCDSEIPAHERLRLRLSTRQPLNNRCRVAYRAARTSALAGRWSASRYQVRSPAAVSARTTARSSQCIGPKQWNCRSGHEVLAV